MFSASKVGFSRNFKTETTIPGTERQRRDDRMVIPALQNIKP
jgi:hypothetical protein